MPLPDSSTVVGEVSSRRPPTCMHNRKRKHQRQKNVQAQRRPVTVLLLLMVCFSADRHEGFVGGTIRPPRKRKAVLRHYEVLTNQQVSDKLEKDSCVLLDVRCMNEARKQGTLAMTKDDMYINVPIDAHQWPFDADEWVLNATKQLEDKTRTIIVACADGIRSKIACQTLERNGFRTVFDLNEGFYGWREARFPVVPVEGAEELFEPPW